MNTTTMEPTAIVLGLSTNGLANVRALGQHKIPVTILLSAKQARHAYAATRYGQKIVLDITKGKAILTYLNTLPATQSYILYPTMDSQVIFLSEYREQIPSNCLLPFPNPHIINMLIRKEQLDPFCRSVRFPVPATFALRTPGELDSACQALTFPIIAKTPVKVYKDGLDKAYILSDKSELRTWYESIHHIHQEFVLQEYIPGTDYDVFFTMQYISSRGQLLASFTGRKIRQWLPLRGGTASAEPAYNEHLAELTYAFFKQAGYWGMCSLEYKQDARTGKFYIIEPTIGRIDFQESVAIANGVNIPWIAYQDLSGHPVQPAFQKKSATKAWMHTLNDRLARDWYLARQELTYWQWLMSLRHVRACDLFSFRDPGPTWLALKQKIRSRLKQ